MKHSVFLKRHTSLIYKLKKKHAWKRCSFEKKKIKNLSILRFLSIPEIMVGRMTIDTDCDLGFPMDLPLLYLIYNSHKGTFFKGCIHENCIHVTEKTSSY